MDSSHLHLTGRDDASHRKWRSRGSKETRREREFYSYFDSVLANVRTKPQLCDLHDPEAVTAHEPKASVDTTLTAFTQLAALRLNAKRAMIFFFDAEYAYVMAESTQSLSLSDDSQHDPGDSLWLGFTKIPRGLSVCEVTTDLPANSGSNAQDPRTASIVHIINNLTEDTRFCDRPYVRDGPKARFYAGVPITTPIGVNIGALCVLDDKPREGLEPHEVSFLVNISSAIMSHLDLIRAKEDNQRSHSMTTALGAFMEGKSDLDEWWHHSAPSQDNRKNSRRSMKPSFETPPATSLEDEAPSSEHGYFPLVVASTTLAAAPPTGQFLDSSPDQSAELSGMEPCGSVNGSRVAIAKPPGTNGPLPSEIPPEPNSLAAQIKSTVTRAAGLVRAGIRADGVIFLDATVGTFGGLVTSTQGLSQTETDTDLDRHANIILRSHADNEQEGVYPSTTEEEDESKHSVVLGSAHSPNIAPRTVQQARIKSKDLKTLLRHYPHGQIWHFNSDGLTSDEDDFSNNSASTFASALESAHSETGQPPTPSGRRTMRRSRARKKDALLIRKTFPGVKSVMFLGMWDPQQERWYGAAIALSYAPTRIFSLDSELKYAAAFCDVLQGEIWRLEAQELGRAKNQFISSISHELRSPLHGILCSAEVLSEQEGDTLKSELIRSIETCGTTLLDVINDLLDYSGLNQDSRIRRKMRPSKTSKTSPPADKVVMLSTLTEDAIEAACLGHRHKHRGNPGLQQSAIVTLDLDVQLNASQWLGSSTIGSWKRVVLNLTTNALKYCPAGYISISLKRKLARQRSATAPDEFIELVVEDSGIGMTEEFQTRNLFRPFQQEDKLSPGTGLGLNLVAQIVKSMNGTVHVQSRRGIGTTVKVTLPARRGMEALPSLPATAVAPSLIISLVGFNSREADSHPGLSRLLTGLKSCVQQLGSSASVRTDFSDPEAAVFIVHEQRLRLVSEHMRQGTSRNWHEVDHLMRPVLTICLSQPSALTLQSSPIAAQLPPGSQFLWLPVGPAKLAAAVSILCKSALGAAAGIGPEPDDLSGAVELLDVTPRPLSFNKSGNSSDYFLSSRDSTAGARNRTEPVECRDLAGESTQNGIHETPASAPALSRSNAQTVGDHLSRGAMPSLLLVEDNVINLRILEVFAKRAGHGYFTARDGKEAVDTYQREAQAHVSSGDPSPSTTLDIIILDLNMPVMDGFQAARAIRRFEADNNLPRATIIAVTGLGDATAHDEAFESGMDMFLTKPVKMKELAEIIAKIRKR